MPTTAKLSWFVRKLSRHVYLLSKKLEHWSMLVIRTTGSRKYIHFAAGIVSRDLDADHGALLRNLLRKCILP